MPNLVLKITNLLKENSNLRVVVDGLKVKKGELNKYILRGEKMKSVSRRKDLTNEI